LIKLRCGEPPRARPWEPAACDADLEREMRYRNRSSGKA
jgi:hypothetical protein